MMKQALSYAYKQIFLEIPKGSSVRIFRKQSRQFMDYIHRLCWHANHSCLARPLPYIGKGLFCVKNRRYKLG